MVTLIGLGAVSCRRNGCVMKFYGACLALSFILLAGSVATCLKAVFTIHAGSVGDLQLWKDLADRYGSDPAVTSTWDDIHSKFDVHILLVL